MEDLRSASATVSVNANSITCSSISAGTVLFNGELQQKTPSPPSKSPPESKSDSPVAIAEQPTDTSIDMSSSQPEKKKKKKKIIKKIKKVKKSKQVTDCFILG